jgi:NAD(P)-dependent dehydrogenase (short-subunit alcohol dehydrogenase family)
MSRSLADKVALVTGGASGIGRGIVERFVEDGARVLIADVNVDLMTEVALGLGDAVDTCEADVLVEADVERMVATAVDRFGQLDIAANVAFGLPGPMREAMKTTPDTPGSPGPDRLAVVPFWEQDSQAWKAALDGVLYSVFLCIKHEAAQMAAQGDGGAIINISSINARQCGEGMSSYCAAKAGVEMLVRCAAMELGPHQIRVNGIAPGLIRTPATEGTIFQVPGMVESFARNTPLGRYGYPSDIAAAASFLAGDDGTWITAETLTVDGGEMTREYPRRSASLAS